MRNHRLPHQRLHQPVNTQLHLGRLPPQMPVFDFQFTVRAPLTAVRDFHRDTSALRRLTPPPTIVQLHAIEPYEHKAGCWGFVTRLLFARPNLHLMFTYRKLVTRWHLRRRKQ